MFDIISFYEEFCFDSSFFEKSFSNSVSKCIHAACVQELIIPVLYCEPPVKGQHDGRTSKLPWQHHVNFIR